MRAMRSGRFLVIGFVSNVVLCASAAYAGEAVVKTPETVVRSAPYEVAPVIARLRAGFRLPADDRPQGDWRRVQLPDGRFGLVHDADVQVTAGPSPAPPAPPPVTVAPPPLPTYPPPLPKYPPPQPAYPWVYAPGYAPWPGYAFPPPVEAHSPPPGFHEHDGGYVRLHFGGGYTSLRGASPGETIRLHGGSLSFGAAVGGAIAPNVILYGAMTYAGLPSPTAESRGSTVTLPNLIATASSLGGGAAYYFQPLNLYVAGTLLAMSLNFDEGNRSGDTRIGLGFEGLVGKEWWVSGDWGLGFAAQVLFASMTAPADPPVLSSTWTVSSFGLLVSATFN
jgi:hypothetical protein